MFLATYILKRELTTEQKLNLLSYFKSKESTRKINDIYEKVCKINKSLKLLTNMFENINIKEICRDDMTFEFELRVIKLKFNGKIDIYKRFDYNSKQIENEETNKRLLDKDAFISYLSEYFKVVPEINFSISPIKEEFIGYFDIDIDEELVSKFIEISK